MPNGVLLTAAAAAEHPLIDLDSTVFVQFILFALTAFVATRFLFRPYLKMREDRTAGIDGARDEASRTSAQADAQLAEYETKLSQARAHAEEERRKLRAEAAAHEREVLDKTRTEALTARNDAQKNIASETEAARAQLEPRAAELASALASKLLGREIA